jgi:hypothetical protein
MKILRSLINFIVSLFKKDATLEDSAASYIRSIVHSTEILHETITSRRNPNPQESCN